MSNQLVKIEQQPIAELMSMAKAFAESGMFADTKSAAQAIVKIQAGQEIGIPPFAAMTGIHIIAGKPTIGAGLIASRVKGSGKYDYKVKEQSDKVCSIDFYQGKEMIGNSTFTIEDAKKASTRNMDKFPKNMLFARAISNGVKWFCPDVFAGPVYVPEEMDGVETVTQNAEVVSTVISKQNPKLGDKGFSEALARIDKGETELIHKIMESYTLSDVQRSLLEERLTTIPVTETEAV